MGGLLPWTCISPLFLEYIGFCSKFFVFLSLLFSRVMAYVYIHEFFYLILG